MDLTGLDYITVLKSSGKRRRKREAIDKINEINWSQHIFKIFYVLRQENKQMNTQTNTRIPGKQTVKNTICFDVLCCSTSVLQWTVLRTFLRKECM